MYATRYLYAAAEAGITAAAQLILPCSQLKPMHWPRLMFWGRPDYQIFDESTMKRLCEVVLGSLPPQATRVTLISQEKNPVLIESKETFLIVISYDWHGTPYSRSVMFLNRKTDQLRFQLTAPDLEFRINSKGNS